MPGTPDWAAKRERLAAKLEAIGHQGTVTFASKALNASKANVVLNVFCFPQTRNVDEQGAKTLTALLTTTDRDIYGGELAFEGKRYKIIKLDQIGDGVNHLMSKVVASEL